MKTSSFHPIALPFAILLGGIIFSEPTQGASCPAPSFVPAGTFAAGTSPAYTVTNDFNGDGKPDLAVANEFSANVSVLLGNGNGTFQPAVNYGAGSSPNSVVAADFNGDGKRDLALTDAGSGSISVLLANGDGTFQAAVNYGAGDTPRSVILGDFNGDGKVDLAVANRVSANVSVLLGNGNGTFQVATNFAAGVDPLSIAVGDFNGDGKPDLAVANAALFDDPPSISVLLGNGNGTFQAAVNYAAGASPRSVAVGDFNGDGKVDLAVANYGSFVNGQFTGSTTSVLLGNGDGTFQPPLNYSAGAGSLAVVVADFNGDGKPDLAVANDRSFNVSLLLGNGNGTFQAPLNFSVGAIPRSVAVGDFNADSRPDLAVTVDGGVLIMLNTCASVNPAAKYLVSSSNNSPLAGSAITITAQLADANNNP
ncbi:MAG: hypothetical protein DME26_15695, partial [Verrucomicrobia bacterium]